MLEIIVAVPEYRLSRGEGGGITHHCFSKHHQHRKTQDLCCGDELASLGSGDLHADEIVLEGEIAGVITRKRSLTKTIKRKAKVTMLHNWMLTMLHTTAGNVSSSSLITMTYIPLYITHTAHLKTRVYISEPAPPFHT